MKPVYRLDNLTITRGGRHLLAGLSLDLPAGELAIVLGPNGAGKTTLLRALAGLEPASSGAIHLGEKPLASLPRRAIARQVALVEATLELPFGYSVEQVVMMGRAPHMDAWFEGSDDWAQVNQALTTMDCAHLRHRDFRNLSSGEKQRVLVASALAQQPCVLLLDESAAFLDIRHQVELFTALRQLTRQGYLIVAVTHDWNLAARWGTRLILLDSGRLAAAGSPAEVTQPALLERVFGIPLDVVQLPGRAPLLLAGDGTP